LPLRRVGFLAGGLVSLGGLVGRRRGSRLEGLALDRQAFLGEARCVGGADALDAGDQVVPVLEFTFLALVHDALGHGRADAAHAVQFGLGGLVDVSGMGSDCTQQGHNGQQFLEHGNPP
jgi:hypothetical protein